MDPWSSWTNNVNGCFLLLFLLLFFSLFFLFFVFQDYVATVQLSRYFYAADIKNYAKKSRSSEIMIKIE